MPDVYDKSVRSNVMRSVHSQNTKPEVIVSEMVQALGYQFSQHQQDLPGKPDIALLERRKVILVHGCFWHQHPGCEAAARPQSNTDYWNRKLDRNIQRDQEHIAALRGDAWHVLVIWECETKDKESLRQKLDAFLRSAMPDDEGSV